jgi:multicomponent Na+:H+ antiporter subunit D
VTPAQLIVACLLLPLAGALAAALPARPPRLRAAAGLGAAALLLGAALALVPRVWAGGVPQLFVLELAPGVALGFRVEPLGLAFALAAAAAWLGGAARAQRAAQGGAARLALAAGAAVGIAFAANVATLFAFGALLTALRPPRALPLAIAAALLALALAATWRHAGTLEFLPGGIVRGGASAALLALYAAGLGVWALAPARHWPRVAVGAFAALKVAVYVFDARL